MDSRVQLTIGASLSQIVFSSVSRGAGACEVAKTIYKQLVFPTPACAVGFKNDNNNVSILKYVSPIADKLRFENGPGVSYFLL